jgi:hypothetical protein
MANQYMDTGHVDVDAPPTLPGTVPNVKDATVQDDAVNSRTCQLETRDATGTTTAKVVWFDDGTVITR